MRLEQEQNCDVLVLGSGIAGISAALEAAETGCSVILACTGNMFSGSSFYPGTWGLGLIGPVDQADEPDLEASIRSVGCGMADPDIVHTFVGGIRPAIDKIRAMGIRLRRADHSAQREYVPCFDHKHRDWNGLEFDSVRTVFSARLSALGVVVLPRCEALELIKRNGRVCGAVLAKDNRLHYFGCRSLVLATGGFGGIFKYHLCTEDVAGLGQYLALNAGCRLVNMEFMQMMPGYLSPAYQTIFNEKTFRFTRLSLPDGTPLLDREAEKLLAQRSTYGPFTSRLASKEIDLAIFAACKRDERGVTVRYCEEMRASPPEFVKTYFDWLLEARGLTMEDPIQIGLFAHAANGGVRIAEDASTGVPGLFAAGEVTGGMHGADRIGGLSTANGLVFGGIAGRSAAADCTGRSPAPPDVEFGMGAARDHRRLLESLRTVMSQNAMAVRSEAGLNGALRAVETLRQEMELAPSTDVPEVIRSRRLEGQLTTAACVLEAALLRRESRGAHYRADYPEENPGLSKCIVIGKEADGLRACLDGEETVCR